MLILDHRCEREIEGIPKSVREDLADALARLELGQRLSMPLSRPMPSVGPGVHELRLRDRSGVYRIIYAFVAREQIYVVHAFKKTTEKTPQHNIDVAKKRIKELKL